LRLIERFVRVRAPSRMDIVSHAKLLMLDLGAAPVMWLMIALSIISVAIIVERTLFFMAARTDFGALASAFTRHLRDHDADGARALLESSRSFEAEVVLAGLRESHRGTTAVREALLGASAVQRTRLDRRLGFLGTLGNNAPFIGLFGTVIGIILAFEELGRAGASASASTAVMSSIAEALVATAIGLLVAIPAVAAYNAFQRKIRAITANGEALSRVLLVHLEGVPTSETRRVTRSGDARLHEAHAVAIAEGA
jgi:biopolymer transport protein ExbB/TolQ